MLSNSSTVRRQNDVAVATKKLSEEKETLVASNKTLEAKQVSLVKSNDMLVASSKALEARQVSLEKSFKEVEAANGALKRSSEIRAAAVMKTSKQLAVRSVANATRNVSLVFAEAIPFIGTGIMLAVTALDVYDACDTLKDINELNRVFDHQQEDQTKVCGMKVPTIAQVLAQTRANAKAVYQSAVDALKKEGAHIAP